MDKNTEILKQRDRQEHLKKQIEDIKSNVPKYIILLTLLSAVGIYYLEDKVYSFFGTGVNFIITVILFLILFSVIYIVLSLKKIKKNEKELKQINATLYDLMKLEVKSND